MAEEKVVSRESEKTVTKGKTKNSGGMGCLVFLLIVILVPILVLVGMYLLSHDFKLFANSYLSYLPGGAGEYFESQPTRKDELKDIRYVATSFMKLEDERIVDKLKLIKSEDRRVYDDLVREMLRLNPNRTGAIIDSMRKDDESSGLLEEVMSDIEKDRLAELEQYTKYLSSLSVDSAVEDLERICLELGGIELASSYIELMDEDRAMKIMFRLSNENKNKIFSVLPEDKTISLKSKHELYKRHNEELEQIAGLIKRENGQVIVESLEKYSDDDKVTILRKLGPRVAGLALSRMQDNDQVLQLVNQIKNIEIEENDKDEITADILKSLKVYRDFDDSILELTSVYLKMDTDKVAKVITDMCINQGSGHVYYLENGDNIEITDFHIATEILRGFPQKKLAEILSKLDDSLASEITRRLTLPK